MEVAHLKKSDISNGEICYYRQKTRRTSKRPKQIVIKISSSLQKIIDRHGDKNSSFVFPVLNDNMSREEQWKYVKATFTKSINQSVNKVTKALNIKQVSAKIMRHSAATLYMQARMNLQKIANMLGHQSTAVTERYISTLDDTTSGEAADVLNLDLA